MPPGKGADDDPFNIRPNAPVSLVRAAKASLKEPTRPVTPADLGRQLFSGSTDYGNRPSSAFGLPSSKQFYEGGPKLALPKLEGVKPGGSSILDSALAGSSTPPRLANRSSSIETARSSPLEARNAGREALADSSLRSPEPFAHSSPYARGSQPDGPDTLMGSPLPSRSATKGARPTAAETVAALKASIAAGEPGFSSVQLDARVPAESRPSMLGSSGAPSFSGDGADTDEEGAGPAPGHCDDLPPRPGTSRGRPSSANYNPDYVHITERFNGPPPGVRDMENGAQVLDMATLADSSGGDGEEDDDDDYQRIYQQYQHQFSLSEEPSASDAGRPGPAGATAAAGSKPPTPGSGGGSGGGSAAPGAGGASSRESSSHSASRPPLPVPLRPPQQSQQTQQQQAEASTSAVDPLLAWRAIVEGVLTELGSAMQTLSSSSARDAVLLKHCSTLGTQVDYARKQPQSSKWLNSPCATFLDANGSPLSVREAISEHLFQLMDVPHTELLLRACSIILKVVKSRQPLLETGKLLYRFSKDTANDILFRKEGLLEPLLRTIHVLAASACKSSTPSNMHEPLVYLNGCVKNTSSDATNQKLLIKAGAIQVLSSLLRQLAEQMQANPADGESHAQVAVQVTGALRNLATSAAHAQLFVEAGAMPAICIASRAMASQSEVVLNIGRILSKLSMHECCQAAMEHDPDYAPVLMHLLEQYRDHRVILVRVAFALGNLTTHSNGFRQQVAALPQALDTIVSTLQLYAKGAGKRPSQAEMVSQLSGHISSKLYKEATREQCVVKLLRLLANVGIHPDVGPHLAARQDVADVLLELLHHYDFGSAEELVLNCVCALTNLSFYNTSNSQVLALDPPSLLRHVTPLLLCDNEEAIIEAARMYGNFSRLPEVRDYMHAARVMEALLLLLDHSNSEVVYSVCGTLINLTVEAEKKDALVGMGGVARLVDVLGRVVEAAAVTDMDVAILVAVCKALCNICADDVALGADAGSHCVTAQELELLLYIMHALDGTDLGQHPEVEQVSSRLLPLLKSLSRKLQE